MVVIAILEAVNATFLENYSKTAGIISSSRDNLCDNRGIKSDNFRTQKEFVYSHIVQFNQQVTINQLSFSGRTPCGVFLSFTNYAFIYIIQMSRVQKKTFFREATSEKERNHSKKSTRLEKYSSVITKLERQVPRFQ